MSFLLCEPEFEQVIEAPGDGAPVVRDLAGEFADDRRLLGHEYRRHGEFFAEIPKTCFATCSSLDD